LLFASLLLAEDAVWIEDHFDTPSLEEWTVLDSRPAKAPDRARWQVVEGALKQTNPSHDSVIFSNLRVPRGQLDYTIEFRHKYSGTGYAGIVFCAADQLMGDGQEIGLRGNRYEGALGEGDLPASVTGRWAKHRLEIRNARVTWLIDGKQIGTGEFPIMPRGGWVGFRHKDEQGTEIDDLVVTRHILR
jgi:hypothetical protein